MNLLSNPAPSPLTRMPCWPQSMAMPFVNILTAPLVAVYAAIFGRPSSLWTEQIFTIFPAPLSDHQNRATACPTRKTLSTLVCISSRHCSCENSSSGARRCMPAVVDQNVDGSDILFDAVDRGTHFRWRGDVEAGCFRRYAFLSQSSDRIAQALLVSAVEDYARAGCSSPRASANPMPVLDPVIKADRPVKSNILRMWFKASPYPGRA